MSSVYKWYIPTHVKYYEKLCTLILLMDEILHRLVCIKPCKSWDKLPTSTDAGFCPSTVYRWYIQLRIQDCRHSGTGGPVVYGAKVAQCGDVGTFDKCKWRQTGVIKWNVILGGEIKFDVNIYIYNLFLNI